ncbi:MULTISPECIES: phosphoenolpyruvate hydrolase family protein [unclassified Clostridium]|uniref:phosphoenolpyruvate hydrolase family protein n=1 Tax=unclassified Clostridium TaxID=2614128 RepID=UPI0013F7FD07|nr:MULTISPECIES: phosphoenolpyruvate hydrolase family protein [unclassified Clostridium]NFR86533.1 helix-turn-helix domain-containing protein [Clostridium botulinum]NFR90787.1 helix-turn-helix domain-containing protein [Clostridium botulinum]NFT99167.1 helix-turn-helix domain-containing protein [Clostridium botulinum]
MVLREEIIKNLNLQIKINSHIIGVATGAGVTAKYAQRGGADLVLTLNSGRFRQMGRSSLAGILPFANSNDMVMEFALREVVSLIKDIPVIFGLNATDPTIDLEEYIDDIKNKGFSGINNYPTVGIIDGIFGELLEEEGCSYKLEVEAIKIAHKKNLFTIAFVFSKEQAKDMLDAGADIICVHLGLTGGGMLGAKKILSLEAAKEKAKLIFDLCDKIRPNVIKMIYGGPIKTPVDVQYMYNNCNTMGYIGGSAFERIPTEKYITNITREFKYSGNLEKDDFLNKMLDGITKHYDYVEFVKEYVSKNYMNNISFLELAMVANISRTHLSSLFKKEVGCSFPQYLVKFRMNKATEIIKKENIQLSEVAELVGYDDYAHFSKMFKKYIGKSPKIYREST